MTTHDAPPLGTPQRPRLLLSTDMDGTIVFGGRISQDDVDAMRRWQQAGHLLVLNTGRSVSQLRAALAGTGVEPDYAVLYTGAVLTDGEARPLSVIPMPDGVPAAVMGALAGRDGLRVYVTTLDEDYVLHDTYPQASGLIVDYARGTLEDLTGHTVVGVPFHIRDAALTQEVLHLATTRWAGQVTAVRNQDFVDLVPPGCTKGTGLARLVERLTGPGGDYEGQVLRTVSLGDSWNDVPMHEAADTAVAMAGAPAEVVRVCAGTVPSLAALVRRLLDHDDGGPAAPPHQPLAHLED